MRQIERRIAALEAFAAAKPKIAESSVRERIRLQFGELERAIELNRQRTGNPGPDLSGIPETPGMPNIEKLQAVIKWDQENR